MNNTIIKQKILGCLYGQAIGDAMGMPSELWSQQKVRSFFGEITGFLAGPKENIAASTFEKGEYTDDTEQALALIHSIIECDGEIIPQNVAKHILAWAEDKQAFEHNILGPTSKASLLAIKAGKAIDDIIANGVTNGSAMRVAPVGCLLPTHDKYAFIQGVVASCCATHKSDIAIAGATIIAWTISRAIEDIDWMQIKMELPDLANEVQKLFESTFSPSLGRRINWAFNISSELVGKSRQFVLTELYETLGAGMDIIETVPTALAIVDIVKQDPITAAYYCANLGGDTDTIGAIATAICGAIKGIKSFPPSMISTINAANNIDFEPLAVQLTKLRLRRFNYEKENVEG